MIETREVATLVRDDGEVIELAGSAELDDGRNTTQVFERTGTWFARGGFALLDWDAVSNKGSPMHEGSEISTGRRAWRMRTVKKTYYREPALEAAIWDAPGDEGCWSVYLDWLREHGDAVLTEKEPNHSAEGWLQLVEKKHGFVTHARIRGGYGALPVDAEQALRSLSELPRLRFLRRLDVQPFSWVPHGSLEDAFENLLRAFERVPLPSVQELELGPFWDGPLPEVGSRRAFQLPRLKVPLRDCVRQYRRTWLEAGRSQQEIVDGNEWGIERARGCWRTSLSVKVNGRRALSSMPLRDGDRLHGARGRTATFRGE